MGFSLILYSSINRSNMKGVFLNALIYAISQGLVYYVYAAGFSLGAYLVISDPSTIYHASYQEVFRYDLKTFTL